MKTMIVGVMLLTCALTAAALDKAELDGRIRTLTAKFAAMQDQAEKRVPAEQLRKAQGIILLDRTKAGFIFAYQGGGGVALARDPKSGKWSPPAFLSASEASLGFQIGGEQNFFVILLMNTNATRMLTDPRFNFGGEARGTAGNASDGVEGTVSSTEEPVLVYSNRKGLYGGAAIKGGAISPDENANRIYYEQSATMKDILFDKKFKPTQPAQDLVGKINAEAKKKDK